MGNGYGFKWVAAMVFKWVAAMFFKWVGAMVSKWVAAMVFPKTKNVERHAGGLSKQKYT